MIALRPSTVDDAHALFARLHPMTRDELTRARVPPDDVIHLLKSVAASDGATAVVLDGRTIIVAFSCMADSHSRATTFLAAECDGCKLAVGARRWALEERRRYPGKTFVADTYARHPDRDRFMRALGMNLLVDGPRFAKFVG